MPTGVISKWFPKRGFGFIHQASGDDIFFHLNGLIARFDGEIDEIAVGRAVSYEIIADIGDRNKAASVRFLNGQGKEA